MRPIAALVFFTAGCSGGINLGDYPEDAADTSVAESTAPHDGGGLSVDTAVGVDTDTAPIVVDGVAARTLSLGYQHACALDGGKIRCWGSNAYGQLGDGTTTDSLVPVTVAGVPTAIEVAVGGNTSCALTTDGSVYCWGDYRYLQLGEGVTSSAPRKVLDGARRVSVGADYTCAIRGDVPVCWGKNSYGALGHKGGVPCGASDICDATPQTLKISTTVDVAAGYQSTCALDRSGRVRCWGRNHFGQLGDGTTNDTTFPVEVTGLRATALGVGLAHACAVGAERGVWCWGNNSAGKLGVGAPDPMAGDPCALVEISPRSSAVPVRVQALDDVTSIAVGALHACARRGDGGVRCWGQNMRGELGDGRSTSTGEMCRSIPASVSVSVSELAAGNAFACAVGAGQRWCWGSNLFGQLGDGSTIDRFAPTVVKW